jgi:hypothetical protein
VRCAGKLLTGNIGALCAQQPPKSASRSLRLADLFIFLHMLYLVH